MANFTKAEILIKKILSRYGILEELGQLYDIWDDIVGKEVAKKIKLCGAKNGEIFVSVASPAYHHHLKLHQQEYLQKINEYFFNKKFKTDIFKKIKVLK
ncbi:MAG: DUF721 domain-containing protein [Endomicrobia bacterium]|nr:DUF721 domain-containing protein [Endomicrobiia bacterium]